MPNGSRTSSSSSATAADSHYRCRLNADFEAPVIGAAHLRLQNRTRRWSKEGLEVPGIEYLPGETAKAQKLDEAIEAAKAEVERRIRHIVEKFGGFRLVVEDGPTRSDDKIEGVPFETGDAVRITIRPKFSKRK
jgi:hypothetical protein